MQDTVLFLQQAVMYVLETDGQLGRGEGRGVEGKGGVRRGGEGCGREGRGEEGKGGEGRE